MVVYYSPSVKVWSTSMFGNTNVPAGGTFQVLGGEAPKQAVGESVEARSDSPREKPTEDKKDDKKSDTTER